MDKKVILICIDGLRPDGVKECGNPYVKELEKICTYTYTAQTVYPSATFPAHMSMVTSVPPQKHAQLTNLYVQPVKSYTGLFEKIVQASGSGRSAMFYNWEPIRDIARPNSLAYATYIRAFSTNKNSDIMLTDACEKLITERLEVERSPREKLRTEKSLNFVFLYLVDTDAAGHYHGWMGEEYMESVSIGIDSVKRMIERFGDEYSVIVMTDHGGHGCTHGSDHPEDMTIPLFFYGPDFEKGKEIKGGSIMDIAPTIAKVMGFEPDEEWEGHSII